jgi:uncharacterized protein (DUF305 family)
MKTIIAAAVAVALGGPALAQAQHGGHGQSGHGQSGHGHEAHGRSAPAAAPQGAGHGAHGAHGGQAGQAGQTSEPAHARANIEAMDKMHQPMMDAAKLADPDEAFVRGMIPHHQGAIDMAEIVLKHGKDEQTTKWARDVIREQTREIKEMEAWLQKRGK